MKHIFLIVLVAMVTILVGIYLYLNAIRQKEFTIHAASAQGAWFQATGGDVHSQGSINPSNNPPGW